MEWVALIQAILTVLTPVLAQLATAYVTKKQEESVHATVDAFDTLAVEKQAHPGAALDELSRQLERLQREARRKAGHS